MMKNTELIFHNCEPISRKDIPVLPVTEWRETIIRKTQEQAMPWRIVSLFGVPEGAEGPIRLYAVLAREETRKPGVLTAYCTDIKDSYPSLTPDCPQAHWFEREIAEQWAVIPEGHPWLKPIRFHPPYRKGSCPTGWSTTPDPGVTDYYRINGEEIHEVAVGPVHAGVIEPGHFRFQCHGEHVFHLEISLGYQHRGIEPKLVGGPEGATHGTRTLHYIETLAGDTTAGHAIAYSQACEGLAGCQVPPHAEVLRAVALELERLANHTGDLGALAGDVGFLPTSSFCGRLRGDFLNLTALLSGNRFGRGLIRPGGTGFDINPGQIRTSLEKLEDTYRDTTQAVRLLFSTPSALARFENIGTLPQSAAIDLGITGPAGRASSVDRDIRRDYPFGLFRNCAIPVATESTGDVYARAHVRWHEIRHSVDFISEQMAKIPAGDKLTTMNGLSPDAFIVSLVEGWRGEICHVAITGPDGHFSRYKVVDPSFRNWIGLAYALRDQQVSDFPLCNKSFNLSYCGHDL